MNPVRWVARLAALLVPISFAVSGCASDDSDGKAILSGTVGSAPATLLLGEIHGTREVPDQFLRFVEALSSRRRPLRVGLEMPVDTVRTGCSPASVADPFWTNVRDGRSSEAAWRLLCRLKALEARGRIRLFGFVVSPRPRSGHPYAAAVAENVDTSDRALLLVGNFHARRSAGSLAADLEGRGHRVVTLTVSSEKATAWTCDKEGVCTARPFSANFCGGAIGGKTVRIGRWSSPANAEFWDACLAFPTLTASPPHAQAR